MAHKRNPGHGTTARPQDLLEVPQSPQDRDLQRDQVYKKHKRQQKESMIQATGIEIGGVRVVKREGRVEDILAEAVVGIEDAEETVENDGEDVAQTDEVHDKEKQVSQQVLTDGIGQAIGQSDANVIDDSHAQPTAAPTRQTPWERAVALFNRVFNRSKK